MTTEEIKHYRITSYEYKITYMSARGSNYLWAESMIVPSALAQGDFYRHVMDFGIYLGSKHVASGAIIEIEKVETIVGNVEAV